MRKILKKRLREMKHCRLCRVYEMLANARKLEEVTFQQEVMFAGRKI